MVVIDDDEDTRELLGFALRQRGATVDVCSSGTDALTRLGGAPVDVVLCDLVLPDMHGGDLATRARAAGSTGIWFGLSGHRAGKHDAFDHFRLKPIDINELIVTLAGLPRPG